MQNLEDIWCHIWLRVRIVPSSRRDVPAFTFYIPVPPNSRSSARSKLTRLTIQQFHELSTDVYDELVRRKNENEGASGNYI